MISAIILAAGLSSRMGRPKLLLKLGKKCVIEHVVDTALRSKVDEVIIVLGANSENIQQVLKNRRLKQVFNPDYQSGQGSSVVTGVGAARQDANGLLFLTGDQPLISKNIIDLLVTTFNENDKLIVRPLYGKRPGNPCLFSSSLRQELLGLQGDVGGRAIIDKYSNQVLTVPVPDGPEGLDLDTIEDFKNLTRIFEGKC